jgi:hypothetical protein
VRIHPCREPPCRVGGAKAVQLCKTPQRCPGHLWFFGSAVLRTADFQLAPDRSWSESQIRMLAVQHSSEALATA